MKTHSPVSILLKYPGVVLVVVLVVAPDHIEEPEHLYMAALVGVAVLSTDSVAERMHSTAVDLTQELPEVLVVMDDLVDRDSYSVGELLEHNDLMEVQPQVEDCKVMHHEGLWWAAA